MKPCKCQPRRAAGVNSGTGKVEQEKGQKVEKTSVPAEIVDNGELHGCHYLPDVASLILTNFTKKHSSNIREIAFSQVSVFMVETDLFYCLNHPSCSF